MRSALLSKPLAVVDPPSRSSELTTADYDRIFRVLADCDDARTSEQFKELLLESLEEHFGFRNTNYWSGSSFSTVWIDPNPLQRGKIEPLLDSYRSGWYTHDVFGSPDSIVGLMKTRVTAITELRNVSADSRRYLDEFLHPAGLHRGIAIYLDIADSEIALAGVYEEEPSEYPVRELMALRLLAGPLNAISRGLSPSTADRGESKLAGLSPRHREVAYLVSEGLSNATMARLLCLSEDTVKKYVSVVLATTGCKSRTQLALLLAGTHYKLD